MARTERPNVSGRRSPDSIVVTARPDPVVAPAPAPEMMPLPAVYRVRPDQARAAVAAEEAAGAALRDSLRIYADRARACLKRLEALRPAAQARWEQFTPSSLNDDAIALGSATGTVSQARGVVRRVRAHFDPEVPLEGGRPHSTGEVLAAIPRRIEALTAANVHRCPTPPPPCGCEWNRIRLDVEEAERAASDAMRDLATLDELREKIDRARARRGVPVFMLPARPNGPGVEVTTPLVLTPVEEEEA